MESAHGEKLASTTENHADAALQLQELSALHTALQTNAEGRPDDEQILRAALSAMESHPQDHDIRGIGAGIIDGLQPRLQMRGMIRWMQIYPEDALSQVAVLKALMSTPKKDLLEESLLPVIAANMPKHLESKSTMFYFLFMLCDISALANDTVRQEYLSSGIVQLVVNYIHANLDDVQILKNGYNMLGNLCLADDESIKKQLIETGVPSAFVATMQTCRYDMEVWPTGCIGLADLAKIGPESRSSLLLDGQTVAIAAEALIHLSQSRRTRRGALTFLDLMSEPRSGRHILVEQNVHRSLMHAGVKHADCFGAAARVLSRLPAKDLQGMDAELDPEDGPVVSTNLLAAADGRRFKTADVLKDVFLPVVDVFLDVVNVVDFYQQGHILWMALLLCGLVFNGMASALHALGQQRPHLVILNLLTFGTAGQVVEAIESWLDNTKTDLLTTLKMIEGAESMLSLLVNGDAIAVAGNLPGYPPLSMWSASLKWLSMLFSVACLSLLGTDLDKQAIREGEDLAHLRGLLSGCRGQLQLLAFHSSEVLAALVLLPMASATRSSHGALIMAALAATSAFVVSLHASRQWEGNWVITSNGFCKSMMVKIRGTHLFMDGFHWSLKIDGASAEVTSEVGTYTARLHPAGDAMHWGEGTCLLDSSLGTENTMVWDERCLGRQEAQHLFTAGWESTSCLAGLARRTVVFLMYTPTCLALNVLLYLPGSLMLQLAWLRFLLFLGAWTATGVRAMTDDTVLQELQSPQVMALMGMAATGLIAQLITILQQWKRGRFGHAALHGKGPDHHQKVLYGLLPQE